MKTTATEQLPSNWCPQGDSNPCSLDAAAGEVRDANTYPRPLVFSDSQRLSVSQVSDIATVLQPSVRLNRSLLFTSYNAFMGMARKGLLDAGRVRRGFALAQSKSFDPAKYHSTATTCHCPDFDVRRGNSWCKHCIAVCLRDFASQELRVVA